MPVPPLPPTSPEFSVLLLAWDDADPSVTVLGGAALPATRTLVYQLAAQQPVLAVYPHLPPAPTPATAAPQPAGRQAKKTAGSVPAANVPQLLELPELGIIRLPAPTRPGAPTRLGPQSRIVGLNDLTAVRNTQPQTVLEPLAAAPRRPAVAPVRSQWPPAPAQGLPRQWQAPAAPYAGASPALAPPPLAAPVPAARPAAATQPAQPARPAGLRPTPHQLAGDLTFDPDPELPIVQQPAAFDEPTAEIGAAEAYDLSAPEDDLVPEAPAPPVAAAALPVPAPTTPPMPIGAAPAPNGLNFRMIQYARRATQLVRDRHDFRVIYAPNWPAWLAALEIRNSSGQPLVLYAANLAVDFAAPAERGWLLEVERMALRRATLILVPDEVLRRRLRAQYGATIGEVRVVVAADEQAVQRVLGEVAGTSPPPPLAAV